LDTLFYTWTFIERKILGRFERKILGRFWGEALYIIVPGRAGYAK
jgi:hypothetical protein